MAESIFTARTIGRAVLISRLTVLAKQDMEGSIPRDLAEEIMRVSQREAPYRDGGIRNSHELVPAAEGGWAVKISADHVAPVIAGHNQPGGSDNFLKTAMKEVLGNRRTLDKATQAAIAARGLGR